MKKCRSPFCNSKTFSKFEIISYIKIESDNLKSISDNSYKLRMPYLNLNSVNHISMIYKLIILSLVKKNPHSDE